MNPARFSIRLRARPGLFTFLSLIAALWTATSCAPSMRNPFEPGGGSRAREGSRNHMVRFQVSCGDCNVSWQAGTQRGGGVEGGVWGKNVVVYLQEGETTVARLDASPTPGGRGVSWIRISVGGKVVAEATREATVQGGSGSLRPLTVETPIPPRGGGT